MPLADGLDYKLHPLADEKSGCNLYDTEGVMGSAIKEMMAKMASLLKQGKVGDMFSIATPAAIHQHMSHLTMACNDLTYANCLTRAGKEEDPIARLKLIAQFFLCAHHVNPALVQCKVPLNPILGETMQRELETGEKFYCEQISHHPPITAF